ncbi:cell shape-determining protein MreB [Rudanella paleaurantiibacter]|uniref:Cell shape-determining protein MreB n=1 Tax=Rudanella paleaurantiibacter TaxID=2614655 RepID=A0A7J5TWR3_9BACT|nr:IPT/TIG domain-containing protein [Rudanella paleaurantiibacter]KAB7729079.1 cell shape-determining protein MreB [Rudanella paleaurantiibacter]
MNHSLRWGSLCLLVLALFGLMTACDNNDTPEPILSVTGISPTSAPAGTTVTISGTNFGTTPASNTVTFGTVPATVLTATSTQLVVTVPANAGSPVTVAANGATAQGPVFTVSAKPVVSVAGSISANTTWTNNNVYLLRGFVYVSPGATLTIQPGTVIKGGGVDDDPTGAKRGGTLIVEQGAKLEAAGTAQQPIVFTSNKPAGSRKYGDWGGIILIGKAPHNRPASQQAEGGIGRALNALNEPADNSGTLRYVRIEFGGIALTNEPNSEINGLTLYGVGSGTTIDHVQVSYSGDDSFEWFGGTVNAKYLVAYRGFDDDFDTDWGFVGKVQFGVSLRDPQVADQSGSNCFESDNFNSGENAGGVALTPNNGLPLTQPIFANISAFVTNGTPSNASTSGTGGSGAYQSAMHLRRNTAISVFNSVFVGYPEGLRLDGTATGTLANANSGALDVQAVTVANSLTAVRGVGAITNDVATTFFNTPAKRNAIVPSSDIAALLNAQSFNLTAPNFLPPASSALLVAGNAATGGKLADSFFTAAAYRGAFSGTDNWLTGWTNFDPQNTNYDR